jgi:hypothetical protein
MSRFSRLETGVWIGIAIGLLLAIGVQLAIKFFNGGF